MEITNIEERERLRRLAINSILEEYFYTVPTYFWYYRNYGIIHRIWYLTENMCKKLFYGFDSEIPFNEYKSMNDTRCSVNYIKNKIINFIEKYPTLNSENKDRNKILNLVNPVPSEILTDIYGKEQYEKFKKIISEKIESDITPNTTPTSSPNSSPRNKPYKCTVEDTDCSFFPIITKTKTQITKLDDVDGGKNRLRRKYKTKKRISKKRKSRKQNKYLQNM